MTTVSVLCCRSDRAAAEADPTVRAALARCGQRPVEFVGRVPARRSIRAADRVVVIGDDSDLAAVALRLLRRELLTAVIVGFATDRATAGDRSLVPPAGRRRPRPCASPATPIWCRWCATTSAGCWSGSGRSCPVGGTVYVDETRGAVGPGRAMCWSSPTRSAVWSSPWCSGASSGWARRSRTYRGRAVQIGTTPPR